MHGVFNDFALINTNITAHHLLACYQKQEKLNSNLFKELNDKILDIKKSIGVWPIHICIDYIRNTQNIRDDDKKSAYRYFYKVTSDFEQISKVVCNDFDVVNDLAVQIAMQHIDRNRLLLLPVWEVLEKLLCCFALP